MPEVLAEALGRLPHGPEFRFLDRLTSLDPGKAGTGEYRVRGDEVFLRGHFPGQPIFPGVLLIEATAQLAGVVARSEPGDWEFVGLKLTAVHSAKILGAARPGELLQLEARILGRLGNLIQARVAASADGKAVFHGEVTLSGTAGNSPAASPG